MHKIDNPFITMLQTRVRDKQTMAEEIQQTLYKLGEYIVSEIIGNEFVKEESVITPLNKQFQGLIMLQQKVIVISTKDDYENFAAGISDNIKDCLRGYMDFNGVRGSDTFSSPIRSVSLPEIRRGEVVDTVIVAKSVLATGCTAISLLRKAIEKYMPDKIIVASLFYSEQGVIDLKMEIQKCKIYVCGQADSLNNDGMLLPGVGNLDNRTKTS